MESVQTLASEWSPFTYSAPDGLRLAGRRYGWQHRERLPVVCLPGLTRNSADFHELACRLAIRSRTPRPVLCLDYRGRGESQFDSDWRNYNVQTETEDVLTGLVAAGVSDCAVIGTSRGGLIAMAIMAMRPGILRAVVLNDVGPVIQGKGLIRIRNTLGKWKDPASWDEAAAHMRAANKHQFPEWDHQEWIRQAERILVSRDGRLQRRFDPKLLRTLSALNLDYPLPEIWPQFEALRNLPVLVLRGENSDLLDPETVAEMHRRHPQMESVEVPDQGHAPDLGSGDLPQRIEKFLRDTEHNMSSG